jgi:hypothetical protein
MKEEKLEKSIFFSAEDREDMKEEKLEKSIFFSAEDGEDREEERGTDCGLGHRGSGGEEVQHLTPQQESYK